MKQLRFQSDTKFFKQSCAYFLSRHQKEQFVGRSGHQDFGTELSSLQGIPYPVLDRICAGGIILFCYQGIYLFFQADIHSLQIRDYADGIFHEGIALAFYIDVIVVQHIIDRVQQADVSFI